MSTTTSEDETNMTELTIAPDGRVFTFGTSRRVLEVLEALNPNDDKVRRLLAHVRKLETVRAARVS